MKTQEGTLDHTSFVLIAAGFCEHNVFLWVPYPPFSIRPFDYFQTNDWYLLLLHPFILRTGGGELTKFKGDSNPLLHPLLLSGEMGHVAFLR